MEHLCVWCGRSYGDERKLKTHERLHHFKSRFPCGVCGSTFSTKTSRRNHAIAVHRLVPGSQEFYTAVAAEANLPTATCPEPIVTVESFPCGFCASTFALQPVLIDHMVRAHGFDHINAELFKDVKPSMQNMSLPSIAPISRTFKCRLCTSVFSNKITRNQHLVEIHGLEQSSMERHNAFNLPIFNAPILQGTTLLQQNQTYQPSYIPIENSYQVIEQNNVECHYDIKPTVINAPTKQTTEPMQQNQIYQPPDIPVENLYQATSVQMSMNNVQYQIVNPLNVMNHHFNYNNHFNNTNLDHDSQNMSICVANSERTKLKDITVSGTNVLESSFKDSSVHDMNVPKDFVIHTEEISPNFSNSTISIPKSYTMSSVQCPDINELNVVNPNLNNSDPYSTYTSNCDVTPNEVKPIKCPVCNAVLFEVNGYKHHIQSAEHKFASELNFKDRIDFEANTVFSNCTCTTVVQFLSAISTDFNTLVKHLLLLNNSNLIDLSFMVLFNDRNLISNNKNIVVSKNFSVQNEELSKDTDLYVFYNRIGKSLISQYDEILNLNPLWTLDEMVSLEIIIKKPESEMRPMSLVTCDSNSIEIGSPKKTEPLQLSKCKICKLFLVQRNYEHHLDIIAHKIAMFYLDNEKILVNPDIDNLQDCFLNCRFRPENQMSINVFLSSIELELSSLIYHVLELKLKNSIKTVLKLCAIYNKNVVQTEINNLGSVEMFTLTNEIIHPYTSIPAWYHHITTLFESKHQMLVRNNVIRGHPCSLTCTVYLDIDFYEVDTKIL